jgi:nucleoside-diphosphate-sugar epimerase
VPRAVVVGGTGLIGGAVARRLLAAGWGVTVTGRDPARFPPALAAAGARFAAAVRDDPAALAAAVGAGADLLVDCACFTAAEAALLVPFAHAATSTVLVSSKAVYVDDAGRHANSDEPPRFARPVTEDQAVLPPGTGEPGTREGYGPHKVAAERVLLDCGAPVTVLRPSKVHGPGDRRPREWWVVKRVLDRRPILLLAGRGAGADHPSAAENVAALVETVARRPGRRVLNAADPDCPDGATICRTIARLLGHGWEEVLLGDDAPAGLGRHPWDRRPPIRLDTSAAEALGYRPAGDHAATVAAAVARLVEHGGAGAPDPAADYPAEDAYLRSARA